MLKRALSSMQHHTTSFKNLILLKVFVVTKTPCKSFMNLFHRKHTIYIYITRLVKKLNKLIKRCIVREVTRGTPSDSHHIGDHLNVFLVAYYHHILAFFPMKGSHSLKSLRTLGHYKTCQYVAHFP